MNIWWVISMNEINEIVNQIEERIKSVHIGPFKYGDRDLFLVSQWYPGVWLEHVYDAVIYAKMYPEALYVAVNTIKSFMEKQKDNGQLPCYLSDGNRLDRPKELLTGYSQIQEVVSFARLCLEVCEMANDNELLLEAYNCNVKWDNWLRNNRMTTNRGLIELFFGYDAGHDKSARFNGIAHPGNKRVDGVLQNASCLPDDDGITPMLAVDMNCHFYGTQIALSEMARKLGKTDEAKKWEQNAKKVKENIFLHLFDKDDAFFYDVDRNGNKIKLMSSTILHLFLEKVLDKEEDKDLIDEIYRRHLKNPNEFWTNYPFPSMAICEPSTKNHPAGNCWGYFSQALIALRCTRWMDYYGMDKDFDVICEKWLNAWTNCFHEMKFGQELDPITGKPSICSEWYSACMLFYLYCVKRLNK